MTRKLIFTSTFLTLFFFQFSFGQAEFQKLMKQLLSTDYPDYQWRNIPLNGYGVATTYAGNKPSSHSLAFLGGTYAFFGLKKVPSSADSLMIPNEIIEAPCSPGINTTISLKRNNIFQAILPNIVSLFSFSATVRDSLSKYAVVEDLEVCDRRIQEGAATQYIKNLKTDPLLIQEKYNNDELIFVVRDVVIKKLKVSITTGRLVSGDFEARLHDAGNTVVGDSAQLAVKLSKLTSSTYTLEIATPVVAGFLAVKKGADSRGETVKNTQAAITGWNKKWMIQTVPIKNDKAVIKPRR
jgi:hypothetical protein